MTRWESFEQKKKKIIYGLDEPEDLLRHEDTIKLRLICIMLDIKLGLWQLYIKLDI